MENLLEYLREHDVVPGGKQLTSVEIMKLQKNLNRNGLPEMPENLVELLKSFNGVQFSESAILGFNPENENLDLLSFNKRVNGQTDSLILAYDEFSFLVYNAEQKGYFLTDRDSGENLEEFYENELDLALIGMIHLDDD